MCGVCGCSEGETRLEESVAVLRNDPAERSHLVSVEQDILSKNDALAAHNRQHFNSHSVLALNLVSSPGAGKTTLLNILFGYYTCDEGQIFIKGEKVNLSAPKDAITRGVGMIHQHFALVPPLTVTENIVLGADFINSQPYKVEAGDYIKITVTDTGIGIDKETRERIFEPFFTTKTTGEGTGLGLSVSYAIVKEHQGTIKVSSGPGKGALFTLRFPAVVDTLKGENHEQHHDLTAAGE